MACTTSVTLNAPSSDEFQKSGGLRKQALVTFRLLLHPVDPCGFAGCIGNSIAHQLKSILIAMIRSRL